MKFPDRTRRASRALAIATVMAIAKPGVGYATEASEEPEATPVGEVTIAPGRTLTLEPEKTSSGVYKVAEGEDSTLPAGWSVLTSAHGLRITAAASAPDGEFTIVEVTNPDGVTDELKVTVERPKPESDEATSEKNDSASSSESSKSWIDHVVLKVTNFFGS